jgi:hypothetical protein
MYLVHISIYLYILLYTKDMISYQNIHMLVYIAWYWHILTWHVTVGVNCVIQFMSVAASIILAGMIVAGTYWQYV